MCKTIGAAQLAKLVREAVTAKVAAAEAAVEASLAQEFSAVGSSIEGSKMCSSDLAEDH